MTEPNQADMPERIWIAAEPDWRWDYNRPLDADDNSTEYVRADLASVDWMPIESGFPDGGRPVLAFFRYPSTGKGRTVRAMWVPHLTMSEDEWGDFQGDTDYNEKTDLTYWPEGWYETNECEETHWKLAEEVTHWTPLPAPPSASKPDTSVCADRDDAVGGQASDLNDLKTEDLRLPGE